jgi:tetratricopeptide (TPR) repeat protein
MPQPPLKPDVPRRRRAGAQRPSLAQTLRSIAELAWSGQHEQAIERAGAALAAPRLGAAMQLELLDRRADSLCAISDMVRARDDAEAMLQRARRARSMALEALALCRLAAVQTRQGRLAQATDSAAAALAAARRSGKRKLEALALFRLSEAQFRAFDNAAALRHAEQAAAIFAALGDGIWQGRALWAMAFAHEQLGQLDERERSASAALALARENGDQEGIGAACNILYREHADMAVRLKGLKQALAAFAAAGQKERAGASLGNLAMTYSSLGLYARARNIGRTVAEMDRSHADRMGLG